MLNEVYWTVISVSASDVTVKLINMSFINHNITDTRALGEISR